MSQKETSTYAEKMNWVRHFIDTHLNDELSLDQLSEISGFSKFHFHRQFAEYVGVNVYRYIQLMRLKQASYQLVFQRQFRIIDIALDAGFESAESFARAFKKVFGQTPSAFRSQPEWNTWHEVYEFSTHERAQTMEVNIVNFKETKIAVYEHRGSPKRINDSAAIFIEWRKEAQLSPVKTSQTFGIPYSDPNITPEDEFRFDVSGSVTRDVPENRHGVVNKTIPGGRCAVLRHKGSHKNISNGVYYLYRSWLPESGEELRDFPVYFHYVNLIPDVAEHELITDIYLPLK